MTPAEFKTKWAKVSEKESAAFQWRLDKLGYLIDDALQVGSFTAKSN